MSQKKSKAKNLRNVLATPYNIHWSESNPDGIASLQKALEELLPLAKLENKSLKLNLKSKKKEKPQPTTPLVKKHNIFRTYLTPGFQSVIRGLERNELCCVLMSGDISPPMIQRVVCSYCNSSNIPLLVVSKLKTITKSTLGFSTMVLGFKKIAESHENHFFPIYEIVSQNRCIFEIPLVANQNEDAAPKKKEKSIFKCESSYLPPVKIKDIYLYRERTNERAFRPGAGTDSATSAKTKLTKKDSMDEDFISFDKSTSKISEIVDLGVKTKKITDKSDSESENSDVDSLDEDSMFFVDNKPDHMLLEGPSNIELTNTQTNMENGRSDVKLLSVKAGNKIKTKVKAMNDRYFLSEVNQDVKPKKAMNKEKRVSKHKSKDFANIYGGNKLEKFTHTSFNPLTVKTIISNPKKVKRKKK